MVEAPEKIQGRRWAELMDRHWDWGRHGLLAVATRHDGGKVQHLSSSLTFGTARHMRCRSRSFFAASDPINQSFLWESFRVFGSTHFQ